MLLGWVWEDLKQCPEGHVKDNASAVPLCVLNPDGSRTAVFYVSYPNNNSVAV